MSEVGIRALKQNASAVVAEAAAGELVTITDRGRPVAQMVPVAASRVEALVAAERATTASAAERSACSEAPTTRSTDAVRKTGRDASERAVLSVFYLDTSAAVKLVTAERGSTALRRWLASRDDVMFSSDLLRTELLRAARRAAPDQMVRHEPFSIPCSW